MAQLVTHSLCVCALSRLFSVSCFCACTKHASEVCSHMVSQEGRTVSLLPALSHGGPSYWISILSLTSVSANLHSLCACSVVAQVRVCVIRRSPLEPHCLSPPTGPCPEPARHRSRAFWYLPGQPCHACRGFGQHGAGRPGTGTRQRTGQRRSS